MEKEIDRILNKVKTELYFSPESRYNFKSDNDFEKYHNAFVFLKTKGFIELSRNGYEITELGLTVIEIGGWNEYQNFLKKEKKNEIEIKRIEFEKSKVDLEFAKKNA